MTNSAPLQPAASLPEGGAWTGFELDGDVFALPYRSVELVLLATPVTRLPFAPAGVEGVASIAGEIIPVLSLRELLSPGRPPSARLGSDFVVARLAGRRFALRADRVLFVADALSGAAEWRGRPVTCLAGESLGLATLQPFLPPNGAPGPIADSRATTVETVAGAGETILAVSAGGRSYGLRAASVVELIEDIAITRLPLVPAVLSGIAVLRGDPLLTFSLARLLGSESDAAPGGYVVVGLGKSRFVVAVDAIGGLQRSAAGAFDILDLATLIAPEFITLAAAMARTLAPAPVADTSRQRFLCVSLGDRFCALPLTAVERILAPRAAIRLPSGAAAGVDGAIEFAGRVIPITDGWRWLSLRDGGLVTAHVVLRRDGERRVLAVNGVQRIVTIAQDDILPTGNQDRRIAGLGRAGGRSLAILSTEALMARGGTE
jgi:purine-binding chemotaxis protein CheW